MIQFLNIALAAGALAASIPLIIHLAHRKKTRVVQWGAMRFLEELVAKSRRKLLINELLLLLFRTLLLLFLALALTRPVWNSSVKKAGAPPPVSGRKAVVVLIDDSASTGYGRSFSTLESMKALLLAYVETLKKGDEISLVKLSELGNPPEDPQFDLEAVKETIRALQPSAVSSDLSRLFESGWSQFARHVNPSREIVLLTDGMEDGEPQEERWKAMLVKLKASQESSGLRVLNLTPKPAAEMANAGIKEITTDQTLLPVNQSVRIHIKTFGRGIQENLKVTLDSDGERIAEEPVTLKEGEQTVEFSHVFRKPGSHALKAALAGNTDFFPRDDSRETIVEVVQSIPVLLVENPGFNSGKDPSFIASALESSRNSNSLYQVTRASSAEVTEAMFFQNRAIILNDIPALDSLLVAALDRFVVSGGGLLAALGPHTRSSIVNDYFARGGEGFLAASLGERASPSTPSRIGSVNSGHPLFSTLGSGGSDPFKGISVREYFKTDKIAADSEILMALDNGDPLLLLRRRNLGTALQFNSSLDLEWNDLAVHSVFVPLVRGMSERISNYILPGHNLEPGQTIIITPQKGLEAGKMRLTGPAGQPLPLKPSQWEGKIAYVSDPCLTPGLYLASQPEQETRYAVSINPREGLFERVTREQWEEKFKGLNWRLASTPADLNLPSAEENGAHELWKVCVLLAILFLLGESLLTRQNAIAQQAVPLTSAL